MKCKFSDLQFGDVVNLDGGVSACGGCGTDLQKITRDNKWVYQGHSGDYDLFEATKLIYCPSCGTRISGYGERCGELGGLQVLLDSAEFLKKLEDTPA